MLDDSLDLGEIEAQFNPVENRRDAQFLNLEERAISPTEAEARAHGKINPETWGKKVIKTIENNCEEIKHLIGKVAPREDPKNCEHCDFKRRSTSCRATR